MARTMKVGLRLVNYGVRNGSQIEIADLKRKNEKYKKNSTRNCVVVILDSSI